MISKKYPLVSIITPSYNQGEFIEDVIFCIKNQSYPNIEHIVIDGGSTDSTINILKKHENSYNFKWISEPDGGMYEAINKGLRISQGEILAYLNTDDLYLPWTVSTIISCFDKHPENELIFGDMININLITGKNVLVLHPEFNFKYLVRKGFLSQPAVFWRRKVIDKVGLFDENLKFIGDCEYWLRAGQKCKLLKLKEILAIERNHSGTQRERKHQQLYEELQQVRKKYGSPTGFEKYLFKISDWLISFTTRIYLMTKFMFYYLTRTRNYLPNDFLSYPYKNLIEFSGFRVTSLISFFITMLPLINKRYKGNWFLLKL